MSLRLKLLLLAAATLVLPWAGCRYAQEMESALREGEQDSLLAVAQTIAASLQGRGDLLYREPPARNPAAAADEPPSTPPPPAAGPYDLRPILLPAAPFIDGYPDEWPQHSSAWQSFGRGPHHFAILSGVFERMLYVLLDVHDRHFVFDAPGANALDPQTFGDRVWLGFDAPDGTPNQVFLAAAGPGSITGRRILTGEYGQQSAVVEPRIIGAWQPAPQGYRMELRVPLSMLGEHFGVLIDDRDARGALPVSYGTLHSDTLQPAGRLIAASPELTGYLARFIQPGLRLSVAATDGRPLARADALDERATLGPQRGILAQLYRRFVDRPGAHQPIDAAASIYDLERRQVIGSLQVTQTQDRWLTLRDRALTRMLNKTLIISAAAVIAIVWFAGRLALRLSRLRAASESALTRDGLVTTFAETHARDELGDVARAFSRLLGRLGEYTSYLRTLAGKLAHEIRTPLTIVRSSLENLEAERLSDSAGVYLARAREGTERLNAILLAMGAATRVEEAIGSAERLRFDLGPVIVSAVSAYRMAFAQRRFTMALPDGPLWIQGAPDLLVQLLDKLIENAVDFSAPGATILVRLRHEPETLVLEVDNPGPPLSAATQGRLFESLWQSRPGPDSRLHFGLGLYIVRLIAESHGGSVCASSLPADAGARFTVRLPA